MVENYLIVSEMSSLRVVVFYNLPVLPPDHSEYDSDEAVAITVDDVCDILAAGGFVITRLGGRRYRVSNEVVCRRDRATGI